MKTLKISACLAFICICVPEAHAECPPETPAQQVPAAILMLGDSITYGTPIVPRGFREPADGCGDSDFGPSDKELGRLLNESRRKSLVLNWGLGGSTSVAGISRTGSSIDTSKREHPASQYFMLIQYGTNDEGFGISSSTTKANIESMINIARDRGVTPLLANLTPRSDEDVATRNSKIKDVALAMNVPFVNHFSTFTSFSMYFVYEPKFIDPSEFIYLHPNQLGYDKLAMNWFNSELQNLIQPSPLVIAPIISLLLDDD